MGEEEGKKRGSQRGSRREREATASLFLQWSRDGPPLIRPHLTLFNFQWTQSPNTTMMGLRVSANKLSWGDGGNA